MHEVMNLILASGNTGVSTVKACTRVAELVQAEVREDNIGRWRTKENERTAMQLRSNFIELMKVMWWKSGLNHDESTTSTEVEASALAI